MGKRQYKSLAQAQSVTELPGTLPLDRPVAVYYRQSSDKQVGNISTTIQTVDMMEYLKQRGWRDTNIVMIDMDAGVSGTKKIDERKGMRRLFELITTAQIGVVACQDEDRLFRDITQIQVNIFIEACRENNVLVLTPSMVYDFAHKDMGTFHARQFRFKSEMAAEYIQSYIRGRLHRAKERLAMQGCWAGGSIPPGFMVDMRKLLPDGRSNDQWRQYVPFEPYVAVINEYFRLFLETGGNISQAIRTIHERGIAYPDPNRCHPPEGFKTFYGMKRFENGYYPSKTTFKDLLTNAAYIGHWTVNDTIVRWNNHPAIVPIDIFMRSFNYLSEQALDGQPNIEYRPHKQYRRPTLEVERPAERPLCEGMIFSQVDGDWLRVGIEYVKRERHYKYKLYTNDHVFDQYVWSKKSDWIDEAVSKRLHDRLRTTFDNKSWEQAIDTYGATYERELKLKESELSALEQSKRNLVTSLETLTDAQLIKDVELRYANTKQEIVRVQADIAALHANNSQLTILYTLRDTYEPTIEQWPSMNLEAKRVILQAFLSHIAAEPFDKHGLRLVAHWRDNTCDALFIPRLPTKGDGFSFEETDRIAALLEARASQVEIAEALPDRKWKPIRDKIFRMFGKEAAVFTPKPIRDFETYNDYIERVGAANDTDDKARHIWRNTELQLLTELLEAGATKMDIAQAFPYRQWTHIRTKVSQLKGQDFEILGDKPMRFKETFEMFIKRMRKEGIDISSFTTETQIDTAHPRRP
ncbi:MAG: recombinase family protein [Chloroflexi bacterium]|nr:recombinase family protein [Chloroflexota bacterium]